MEHLALRLLLFFIILGCSSPNLDIEKADSANRSPASIKDILNKIPTDPLGMAFMYKESQLPGAIGLKRYLEATGLEAHGGANMALAQLTQKPPVFLLQ